MPFYGAFSASQVIHTWCEQNELLKRSLNFFLWKRVFQIRYRW